MLYMLDTDICIELLRNADPDIVRCLEQCPLEALSLSSVTLAELQFGVAKSKRPSKNMSALIRFCAPISVLPFDSLAAETYGVVRRDLEATGKPIGPLDTMIAAHALSVDATLVTNNIREFDRVSGLKVENWKSN